MRVYLPERKPPASATPNQDADIVIFGKRLEFVFETAADKAVVHLRCDEFFQSEILLEHQRGGGLPGHVIGEADVADFSRRTRSSSVRRVSSSGVLLSHP